MESVLNCCGLEYVIPTLGIVVFVWYVYSLFTYWAKRGVNQVKNPWPFVGSTLDSFVKAHPFIAQEIYNEFPDDNFVGTYRLLKPALLLRSPDLIQRLLITDFSHVYNRANTQDPNNNKLAKHLLNVRDDQWKNLRNKLTPTFTSGKLIGMHPQLVECGDSLIKFMKRLEDGRPFDVKDVISRFTMDVISSCAFGLNIDTINDPESQFRKMGLAVFRPSPLGKFMFVFRGVLNPLFKALRIKSGDRKYQDFFTKAVDDTLEFREKNNLSRQDFLHLMNELRKKDIEMINNKSLDPNSPYVFDHTSLVSNAFVFFLAGFETTSTTISFAMYELAINQDIQERLYNEVCNVANKHQNEISSDALNEMVYLEQVVSETLRKYPPAALMGRIISKEYCIPGTNVVLPVGMSVHIPIYAFHHDPQYYPEPEQFIPDRFKEGKESVRKGVYLPFGAGPRTCIAARFAMLEAKLCLAMILKNYKLMKCDKTKVPLEFDRNSFLLAPKGGIWLSVRPRTVGN